ncbi:MAG: hypothetical protein GWM98_04385 [Nitrospinaceae bacterium]|nr:sensor histidine kinase [Nitrospinaceae bacterium]NIR53881.1 sensor histidine kinase [Nitrospinaceae bacterium]NIS84295.1 sensor histidine kinase [Nitrospinaceae bacterium]NIT81102.1 sensor histidine kinase [Nitrospinaceae bacterium]NIU43384.1 sensor histidine kinase [Nitrospinaceae bacterium]
MEYRCAPLLEKGKPVGGVITFRDVTEQRLGEQRIRESLRVKDLLLKEIHHRVKNNMQVISSMLWLQGKDIRQKKYAALFQDCSNRILSMALLHEKLYESSNLSKIDFKDYGASLMRDLAASYGTDADRVEMKIESENVFLDWNAGVPCGLLIQELVSNSLKHAFPRKRKGEIRVSLRPVKGKKLELIVADNGVGFPQGMDFRNTRSLGLQLVTTLAEKQLGGTVRWKRKNKTEFRMIFKETWP